jgi:hypothetical protein
MDNLFRFYFVEEVNWEAKIVKIEVCYEDLNDELVLGYSIPKQFPEKALELLMPDGDVKCLMVYKKLEKFIENNEDVWLEEATNIIRLEKLKKLENE